MASKVSFVFLFEKLHCRLCNNGIMHVCSRRPWQSIFDSCVRYKSAFLLFSDSARITRGARCARHTRVYIVWCHIWFGVCYTHCTVLIGDHLRPSVRACVCVCVCVWQMLIALGSGDSSVVRTRDSWLKGRGFESLQERRKNFLLQGPLSVLTLISVSVPPPCYRSST